MGVLAAVSLGLGVLGAGAQIEGQRRAEQAREQAAELRLREQTDSTNQRQIQRTRRLNEVLAQQNARQGASGFSLSSNSFGTIQQDTLNQFSEDTNADSMNLEFGKISASEQERDAQQQFQWGAAGDAFNVGSMMFNGGLFQKNNTGPVAQTQPKAGTAQKQGGDPYAELYSGTNMDFIL